LKSGLKVIENDAPVIQYTTRTAHRVRLSICLPS